MSTMQYDRRELLALAATAVAGLAGCGGGPSDETPAETTETTEAPTETPADSSTAEPDTYMNGVGSDANISFAVPADGVELTSSSIQWEARADGVTIEEAGEVTAGAGHYHIMVDADPVTPGEIIPSDDAHIHYGTGQSDGVLELSAGEHTLHLQVADGEHRAMALTDTIDVTVSEAAGLSLETSVEGSVVDWAVTADGYSIEPASAGIESNSGHLHAIIDTESVPVGEVIPSDARHIHFGDGSTSGQLDLATQLDEMYEPGDHTIHFQVGSATHRATSVLTTTTVTTQ